MNTNKPTYDQLLQKVSELEKQAQSKAFYQNSFEMAAVGIVHVSPKGSILHANPSFCDMLGFPLEELKAFKNFHEFTPEKWHTWEQNEIWENRLMKSGFSGTYEKEYTRKDGTVFPIEIEAFTVYNDNKNISYVWGIVRDISAKKRAEINQMKTLERLKLAMEIANEGLWEWDYKTGLVTLNDQALKMLGYPDNFGSREPDWWFKQIHDTDRGRVIENYNNFVEGIAPEYSEKFRMKSRSNEYVWIESTARILEKKHDGKPLLVFGFHRDITREVDTQQKLAESELKYRQVFEGAGDAIIVTDKKAKVIDVNPAFTEITGIPGEEIIGRTGFALAKKFVKSNNFPQLYSLIKDTLTGKQASLSNFQFREKFLEITTRMPQKGNLVVGLLRDITDRKLASQALAESEANLKSVIESTRDAIWSVDRDHRILTVNSNFKNEFKKYYGVELKKGDKITDHVSPADQKKWIKRYTKVFKGFPILDTETFDLEYGKAIFEIIIYPIRDEKAITGASVISRDVTERKSSEVRLLDLNNRLTLAARSAGFGVWDLTLKNNALTWDKWMFKLYGTTPKSFGGTYENWKQAIHPDDAEKTDREVNMAISGEKEFDTEFRIIRPDGEIRHLKANAMVIKNDDGEPQKMIGINYDITQHKDAIEALKVSEDKFKTLFEMAPDAYYLNDLKGTFLDGNKQAEDLLGYKKEELIGKNFGSMNLLPSNELPKALAGLARNVLGKNTGPDEFHLIRKDGKKVPVEISTHPVKMAGKKIVLGIARDITRRTQDEQAIRENEQKFKDFFNNNPSATFVWQKKDRDFILTQVNRRACEITYDNALKFIGKNLHEIYANDPEIETNIRMCFNKKSTIEFEKYYTNHFDHSQHWFSIKIAPAEPDKVIMYMDAIDDRKTIEQSLKESNTDLRLAQQFAKIGNWSLDPANGIPEWSDEVYRIYERNIKLGPYPVEEYKKLYHGIWWEKFNTSIRNAIENGIAYDIELKLMFPDGRHKWINAVCQPEGKKGPSGHFLRGTIQDITHFKQIQEDLKESEIFANAVANSTPALLYIWDICEEKNIWANEHHKKFFEGMPGDKQNQDLKTIAGAIFEEDFNRLLSKTENLVNNENLDVIETEIRLKYRETFKWMHIRISVFEKDENGVPVKLIGALFDIDAKKKAEHSLKESETRFKALHNGSFGGITIHDKGVILDCNKGLSDITGYSFEELIGMDGLLLIAEKSRKMVMDNILAEYEKPYEAFGVRKNGEIYPLRLEARMIPYKGEKVRVVEFRDITEQKKVEAELVKAKEKAEESDRLKSAFLANMSHEIRTPMNGILGFADLLKQPELTGEQQRKYVGVIEKSGERMLNIINDLIDISKIESGQVKFEPAETNIREQVEFLSSFFKPEMAKKGLDFSCNFPLATKNDLVFTDSEKLYAILTNLLKNAIKYTPEGSVIFGYEKRKDHFRFYVKDTGLGVPEERRKAIFERFVQADIEDKKAMEGAGLGLAISKAYATMMGGKIWVEPNKLAGSTFFLEIPVGIDNIQTEAEIKIEPDELASSESKSLEDAVILVAEDEETSDMYITEILKNECKEILHVISGKEAVEMVQTNPEISIVLMDIKMPKMSGYEATKAIRKFNTEIVIIAQTAYALAGDREKALEAGCNDYLSKPVKKSDLMQAIDKHYLRDNS